MREAIINKAINNIQKYNDYSDIKIKEIKYGLESIYLTTFKIIVIMVINTLIGSIKELLLIFLFYGLLRLTGFGLHAKKTSHCWISSLLIFVILPNIVKTLSVPKSIQIVLSLVGLILLSIYAPADTKKRPLINKTKRIVYKVLTILIATLYILYIIFTKDVYINSILTISILIQTFLVLPISYKLFGLEYNNYKNYKKGGLNEVNS